MKQAMLKRISSLLLALCMIVGMLPMIVLGEEEKPSVDSEGYCLIWSYEQLRNVAKLAQSHTRYRLATDIYQTDNTNDLGIWVGGGAYFSLDLNGHVLSFLFHSIVII